MSAFTYDHDICIMYGNHFVSMLIFGLQTRMQYDILLTRTMNEQRTI